MNIRRWIRGWLNADLIISGPQPPVEAMGSERTSQPTVRVSLIKAINGRLLEIGVYKPNPRGPDWTYELFIVPEDATIASAITTVFAMKALEN
jgi:hypothetical protein